MRDLERTRQSPGFGSFLGMPNRSACMHFALQAHVASFSSGCRLHASVVEVMAERRLAPPSLEHLADTRVGSLLSRPQAQANCSLIFAASLKIPGQDRTRSLSEPREDTALACRLLSA